MYYKYFTKGVALYDDFSNRIHRSIWAEGTLEGYNRLLLVQLTVRPRTFGRNIY